MEFSVTREAYVFLCSAASGVLIGMLRDIFCVIRKKCDKTEVFTDITDIVFWICAAVIMFAVIFFVNNGRIRWYEFFGVILGSLLYSFTLSRTFNLAFEFLFNVFFKFFNFFLKLLLTPLVFLYNIVFKGIVFIFRPIYKVLRKLFIKILAKARFFTGIARHTLKKS